MDSEAAVCNLALLHAQISKRVQNLETDTSSEAVACRDLFDHVRDKLLEDYRWPVFEAQAALTQLGGEEWSSATSYAKKATAAFGGLVYVSLADANLNKEPDENATYWRKVSWDGWSYAFALPTDLVAVRNIFSGARLDTPNEMVPHALAHDPDLGTLLLCDFQEPDLRYTRRVEAVALWPASFVEPVSLRLGSKLAIALSGNPQLAIALQQASDAAANQGMAAQQRQQHETPRDSRFIEVRGTGTSWIPPVTRMDR